MGGFFSSAKKCDPAEIQMALDKAKEIVASDAVVVFRSVFPLYPSGRGFI